MAASASAGCRTDAFLPLPDAARSSGLSLSATPASLLIRPASSGRLKFVLRDEQGLPVSDYPLTFTIVSDNNGDGTADAQLSSNQGLTDSNGEAVLEIIVGNLTGDERPVVFSVSAACQGSNQALLADVTVTTNAYSVDIVPVPDYDDLGYTSIANARLLFYDDTTCGALDLTNLKAAPTRPRPPQLVAPNTPAHFPGVAGGGSAAVVGLGLDNSSVVQMAGCVDIPGSLLPDSTTMRVTLYMDLLFPLPVGTFQATSDFHFNPSVTMAKTLVAIQSVWQQWATCPLDPARLWIDYTLDALASGATSDPTLSALLAPLRGTVVEPLAGAATSATASPCHGETNSAGDTSLDAMVDNLFSDKRDQLSETKLGTLPSEIASLLDEVRINTQMTIAMTKDANSFSIAHDLLGVTFPDALSSISFKTTELGLPVSSVSGVLATLSAGRLSIDSHGFTMRLGTLARYAFEETSIKSRRAVDALSLVEAVFGLAQGGGTTGCKALDAALCAQIQQSTGCLFGACQSGLVALAENLARAFDALDGSGIDFSIFGSAPVVDLDGDGQADTLGLGGSTGTASPDVGSWVATLSASAGSFPIYGTWTASRVASSP